MDEDKAEIHTIAERWLRRAQNPSWVEPCDGLILEEEDRVMRRVAAAKQKDQEGSK